MDSVIFFNFRADRARSNHGPPSLFPASMGSRPQRPQVHFVCFAVYDKKLSFAGRFPAAHPVNVLAEVFRRPRRTQHRPAETEKYAHVTYFFNGGVEQDFRLRDVCSCLHQGFATYDLIPEMSAFRLPTKFYAGSRKVRLDVFIVNFANPDMVGHTDADKTIEAASTWIPCLGWITKAMRAARGTTLDHCESRHAELMLDLRTGQRTPRIHRIPSPFI